MKELFGLLLIWLAIKPNSTGNSGDVTVIVGQPSEAAHVIPSDHRFDDVADRLNKLGNQALPSQISPVQASAIASSSGAMPLVSKDSDKPVRTITDGLTTVNIPDWTQQGVTTYPADVDHKAADVPASVLQSTETPVIDKQIESQLQKTTYQGDPDPALGVQEPAGGIIETPQGTPEKQPDLSGYITNYEGSSSEQELALARVNLDTVRSNLQLASNEKAKAESQVASAKETLSWCNSQPDGCMRNGASDAPRIESIIQQYESEAETWRTEELNLQLAEQTLLDQISRLEAQASQPQPKPIQQPVAVAPSEPRVVTYVIGPIDWQGQNIEVYRIDARIPRWNPIPRDHIVLDVGGKLGLPSYLSNGDKITIKLHMVEYAGESPSFDFLFYSQATTLHAVLEGKVDQAPANPSGAASIRKGEWVGTWGGFKPDNDNRDFMIELGASPDTVQLRYVTVVSKYGSWSSMESSLYFAQFFVNGAPKLTAYSPDAGITVNRGDKIEVAVSGISIPEGGPVSFEVQLNTNKGVWVYRA